MLKQAFEQLFKEIGEDPNRLGLQKTPERLAKMYSHFFTAYQKDPSELLGSPLPYKSNSSSLITLSELSFFSLCEHHLAPFFGKATLVYLPSHHLLGIGAIHRFIETMSRKLTLQEKLCDELSQSLYAYLKPKALMLTMKATHTCSAFSQLHSYPKELCTKSFLGDSQLFSQLSE